MLLVGGSMQYDASGYTADTITDERYDSGTGRLHETAHLLPRRHRHTATLLTDGTVLVAGGNRVPQPCRLAKRRAELGFLAAIPANDREPSQ